MATKMANTILPRILLCLPLACALSVNQAHNTGINGDAFAGNLIENELDSGHGSENSVHGMSGGYRLQPGSGVHGMRWGYQSGPEFIVPTCWGGSYDTCAANCDIIPFVPDIIVKACKFSCRQVCISGTGSKDDANGISRGYSPSYVSGSGSGANGIGGGFGSGSGLVSHGVQGGYSSEDLVPTTHENQVDYYGGDLDIVPDIDTWQRCAKQCSLYPRCTHWTFHDATTPVWKLRNACFLKSLEGTRKPCNYCISGKLTEPKLFVSDVDVSVQMFSGAPSGFISNDINKGFHSFLYNWYTYIGPVFTAIPSEGATSFQVLIRDNSVSGMKDIAKHMGGKYIYLQKVSDPSSPKIKLIRLVENKSVYNFDGCTGNINESRGGRSLFLCWVTEKASPGRVCCQALTATCLACKANQTIEDYCRLNPLTIGCPKDTPSTRFFGCPSSKIALKDPHDRYVVTLPNDELFANGTSMTNEAMFSLVDLGGDDTQRTVGLKSINGRWLVAYPPSNRTTYEVKADGYNSYVGSNEKFRVKHNEDRPPKYWFKTAYGRYLVARPDGTFMGNATRYELRQWAKFTLECVPQPRSEVQQYPTINLEHASKISLMRMNGGGNGMGNHERRKCSTNSDCGPDEDCFNGECTAEAPIIHGPQWKPNVETIFEFNSRDLTDGLKVEAPFSNPQRNPSVKLKALVKVQSFSDHTLRAQLNQIQFYTDAGPISFMTAHDVLGSGEVVSGAPEHDLSTFKRFLEEPMMVSVKRNKLKNFLVANKEPHCVTNIKKSLMAELEKSNGSLGLKLLKKQAILKPLRITSQPKKIDI